MKNWLRSQRFNNNELIERAKTWMSSQAADSLTKACKNLFPDTTSTSIPAMATLRSSLCRYFLYITKFC
jgi:hypothetical protein